MSLLTSSVHHSSQFVSSSNHHNFCLHRLIFKIIFTNVNSSKVLTSFLLDPKTHLMCPIVQKISKKKHIYTQKTCFWCKNLLRVTHLTIWNNRSSKSVYFCLRNNGIVLLYYSINYTKHFSGTFGKSKYVYYGKHSEGNRFIRNTDLWTWPRTMTSL